MAHYPADRFCSNVKRFLGDSYSVKWEKFDTDHYWVKVFANATGQKYEMKLKYDDFRVINPEVVARAALDEVFDRAMRVKGI